MVCMIASCGKYYYRAGVGRQGFGIWLGCYSCLWDMAISGGQSLRPTQGNKIPSLIEKLRHSTDMDPSARSWFQI